MTDRRIHYGKAVRPVKNKRRIGRMTLALLMLLTLAPSNTVALGSVYFTAANDTLLELSG